jgi:anti-anti-sigma factor
MAGFGITATGPSTFSMSGELDLATAPLVDVAMRDAVSERRSITLHISELTFADSSGIAAILRSAKDMTTGCLVVHGARDGVRRAIDVMDVGRIAPNLHVIPCESRLERPAGA